MTQEEFDSLKEGGLVWEVRSSRLRTDLYKFKIMRRTEHQLQVREVLSFTSEMGVGLRIRRSDAVGEQGSSQFFSSAVAARENVVQCHKNRAVILERDLEEERTRLKKAEERLALEKESQVS